MPKSQKQLAPFTGLALEFVCHLVKAGGSSTTQDFHTEWAPLDRSLAIKPGSLGVILHRLVTDGVLKQSDRVPTPGVTGPGYCTYSLTPVARARFRVTADYYDRVASIIKALNR